VTRIDFVYRYYVISRTNTYCYATFYIASTNVLFSRGPSRQITRITVCPDRETNESSQLEFPAANPHKVSCNSQILRTLRTSSLSYFILFLSFFLSLSHSFAYSLTLSFSLCINFFLYKFFYISLNIILCAVKSHGIFCTFFRACIVIEKRKLIVKNLLRNAGICDTLERSLSLFLSLTFFILFHFTYGDEISEFR